MKENAGAIFGALLLDIRKNEPERWARIRARGAEIDAALMERRLENERTGSGRRAAEKSVTT